MHGVVLDDPGKSAVVPHVCMCLFHACVTRFCSSWIIKNPVVYVSTALFVKDPFLRPSLLLQSILNPAMYQALEQQGYCSAEYTGATLFLQSLKKNKKTGMHSKRKRARCPLCWRDALHCTIYYVAVRFDSSTVRGLVMVFVCFFVKFFWKFM